MTTPPIEDARAYEPPDLVRYALAVLHNANEVIELRALHTRRGTQSGYYRNREALVRDALRIEAEAAGVYVTINNIEPALYARASDRLRAYPREATGNRHVTGRCWIPIDCDPVRQVGISSTDAEHAVALARIGAVAGWLVDLGVPADSIVTADSGNGAHLLLRINLAADAVGDALIGEILAAVKLAHSDEQVIIDTAVANRARIMRLYGTLARKGDSTADRPHRRARLLGASARIVPCPIDVLRRIAALAPWSAQVARGGYRPRDPFATPIDLDTWVRQHLDVYSVQTRLDGARVYVVRCPWRDHGNPRDRAAYVMRLQCGAIAAGCHHNSCRGENWHTLRALNDPTVRAVEAALLRKPTL